MVDFKLGLAVIIVFFLIAVAFLIFRYKKISAMDMLAKRNYTIEDGKKAILEVKKIYGVDMARRVEQIMRLETRHFTSGQYKLTGSAGMEVGKWKNIPLGAVAGYAEINDIHKVTIDPKTGKEVSEKFIVWNSVTDFAKYLAEYILRYGGNYARWNSLDLKLQAEYRTLVNSIIPRFV